MNIHQQSLHFVPYDSTKRLLFFQLLKQLRPHLSLEDFDTTYQEAKTANGYQLLGIALNSRLVALMGYRVLDDFVHGRHLYIDDLVVDEAERSKGLGGTLLNQAEVIAKNLNCSRLRLCTGVENENAKTFYERNGWDLKAVVFKKTI